VMPGVLIVEAMAQAASCLASLTQPEKQKDMLVFLASVDKTRFKKPVKPGDLLELHVKKTAGKAALWKFSGVAEVAGTVMAQAEFSAMVVAGNK
jgi:3-hydroxyacyl-[acyl-carrier-protein] dehydratase